MQSTSLISRNARHASTGSGRKRPAGTALLMLVAVLFCSLPARGARPNDPVISIPLEPLGFQTIQPYYLVNGGSMMTLHFVDERHLLFTYSARSLLPRLADAKPEDDDRNVQAVLLELPSGRVLARTEWRTRDHEQYLWPLGRGRFLLRVRTRLVVLDPLGEVGKGQAFREQPFLDLKRRLGYISVSPEGDLLTVETIPEPKPKLTGAAASAAALAAIDAKGKDRAKDREGAGTQKAEVQIHFFRLFLDRHGEERERLFARSAGMVRSPIMINVPATAEGFLDIAKESSSTYLFDFQPHAGKRVELSPYDTTCMPRPYFVSRSEFVAFGCRGGAEKQQLSGFNLRGEQPWVQVFTGSYMSPFFAVAPAAGRFALSRVLTAGSYINPENLVPSELTGQEVAVIQSHDGRVLLRVQAAPVQRSGQNMDLSPDGLSLAVIRGGKIEIYHLPSLSAKDEKALKLANAAVPEKNDAMIRLSSSRPEEAGEVAPKAAISPVEVEAAVPMPNPAAGSAATSRPPGTGVAPAPTAARPAVEQPAPSMADQPTEPRKAPTLYDSEHPDPKLTKPPAQ